jgi:transcriptional regulator with XRE-family HTH domain
MPAHADLSSVIERQLLLQLGQRLQAARRGQGLSTTALAERVGISRTTLHAVEAGEPNPTMGTYVRVLAALGLAADLALVGTGEALDLPRERLVSVEDARHAAQDLTSLCLHREAVKLLRKQPELVDKARSILARWQATADEHAAPLLNEWSRILEKRDWRRVVANTERARQLRQASPLSPLLPEETRRRIRSEVAALKAPRHPAGTPGHGGHSHAQA